MWVKMVGIDISTKPTHTLMKKFLRCCRSISLTVTDNAADIHSARRWKWKLPSLYHHFRRSYFAACRLAGTRRKAKGKYVTFDITESTIVLESRVHTGILILFYFILFHYLFRRASITVSIRRVLSFFLSFRRMFILHINILRVLRSSDNVLCRYFTYARAQSQRND